MSIVQVALEMGRYMPVHHTGTSFVPEFHTGIYRYTLDPFTFFSTILTVYPCFAFNKYTGTSISGTGVRYVSHTPSESLWIIIGRVYCLWECYA
jgi:hypothetical protein